MRQQANDPRWIGSDNVTKIAKYKSSRLVVMTEVAVRLSGPASYSVLSDTAVNIIAVSYTHLTLPTIYSV